MVDDDLRKKTVEAFNEKVLDNIGIYDNGTASLKYDAVLDNQGSLFEDIINKTLTFFFGTSNEIKEEMYKNNDFYANSKDKALDTVLYMGASGCLLPLLMLIPDKNLQNIIGADIILRFSPIMVNTAADLIKYKKSSMNHRIYPGIVGSVRDYISMCKIS